MSRTGLKTCLAYLLIALSAGAAFTHTTRHFRTLTSDGARQLDLAETPAALPAIALMDSSGAPFRLNMLYGRQPRQAPVTLVSFLYTRCRTICRSGAWSQQHLAQQIQAQGWQVRLLTISFDPAHDTPPVLLRYAETLGADAATWRFATVQHRSDLQRLLNAFGVIVLRDGLGGYSHNAALFLIDETGRLTGAYDMDDGLSAIADALAHRA